MATDIMMSLLITAVAAMVVSYLFRKIIPAWKNYREQVVTMRDVGCAKPHWLFGHTLSMNPEDESTFRRPSLFKLFPKCTALWLGPFVPFLQGHFPDMMKTLLATEEPKAEAFYAHVRPFIGDGLVTSSGEKWKRHRRLITPAFHFDALKKYLVCANDVTTELLRKWSKGDGAVEIFDDLTLIAFDNMLQSVFSKDSGCQTDAKNEYLEAVALATSIGTKRIFNLLHYFDFIFYNTPTGRKFKKACVIINKYTKAIVSERRAKIAADQQPESSSDFLDMLLSAKDADGVGLSDEEIYDQVSNFIFAGHETVASSLSWAFYNLAKYPEFQDRCRDEVNEILKGRNRVEWGDLNKLTFLTMFLKESMRINTTIPGVARKITKPLTFPRGFGEDQYNTGPTPTKGKDVAKTFPSSTSIFLCFTALHHNPHVWENPNDFDPERFTPENTAKRSPHSYLPFSTGPRNCIGKNFAMNEMRVVLALALARFRFSLDKNYPAPEGLVSSVLRPRNGIHLKLERV